jgi:hypothetical protein
MGDFTAEVLISVDNRPSTFGTIEVHQEWIDITSGTATKPDRSWETYDAAGHYHSYDTDGELPTLEASRRHVNCDEDVACGFDGIVCETGYDIIEHECRICGDQVEPQRVPDTEPKQIPGLKSWDATVRSSEQLPPEGTKVSVRAEDHTGRVFFGVAVVLGVKSIVGDEQGTTISTALRGDSPLGARHPSNFSVVPA